MNFGVAWGISKISIFRESSSFLSSSEKTATKHVPKHYWNSLMGDPNQFAFISGLASELEGPILEVGSHDYGSTQNLRPLLADKGEFLGVDLIDGPGVDLAMDLTHDFGKIDESLGGKRFGTIICLSVLEHCAQPFLMAQNLTKLLKPEGKICLSVPFAWKFHGYPSDYWRFTHEGIKVLFPEIQFDLEQSCSSTSERGEYQPLDTEIGKRSLSSKAHRQTGHRWRSLTAGALRSLGKLGPLGWITRYRYLMAPTNILMVGQPKQAAENLAA